MSLSILKEILSGISTSKSVLICDTAEQSSGDITNAFIQKHEQNQAKILLLAFDESDAGQATNCNNVLRKHVSQEPGWWLNAETFNVASFVEEIESRCVVIIDSLSSLLLKCEAEQLYVDIFKLIQHSNVIQLVCQVHEDVVDPADFKLVSSAFSTIVSVQPPAGRSKIPTYSLQHYKPNGKFFSERRQFVSTTDGLSIQPLVAADEPSKSSTSEPKNVHDSISTFRHGLSADEQAARDSLILPYQKVAIDGLQPRGQGKIEYELEEDDDWDEEDPDDDLEI